MPEQNRKPLFITILMIALLLGAAGIIIFRHLPGSYQDFSYYDNPFDNTTPSAEKTGIVSARISLEKMTPTCFSTGYLEDNFVIAVGATNSVNILSSNGTESSKIELEFTPTAIELKKTPGSNIIAMTDGQRIFILSKDSQQIIENYPAARPNSNITSMTITGDFIYCADGNSKLIWEYQRYNTANGDLPVEPCPVGQNDFVLPSAYFELANDTQSPNSIWAVSTGEHLLKLFTPPASNPVKSWGIASFELKGFSGCCNPESFDILPDGQFVTCEKGAILIKIFDSGGKYVTLAADRHDFKRHQAFKELTFPNVQAGDDNKTIYILDKIAKEILTVKI